MGNGSGGPVRDGDGFGEMMRDGTNGSGRSRVVGIVGLRNRAGGMVFGIAIYRRRPQLGLRMRRRAFRSSKGRALPAKVRRSPKHRARMQIIVRVHADTEQSIVAMAVQMLVSACMLVVD
jgi:hypothetical protein